MTTEDTWGVNYRALRDLFELIEAKMDVIKYEVGVQMIEIYNEQVLSDGLLRQATYTTARLGTFRILTNKALEANDGKPLTLYQKSLCGLTVGAIGACVGSPAELALIWARSISRFFAAACSLPFDFMKIQIQKMQPDATGKYLYTGSLDCAMKTLKAGGPFRFYTGFPVYKMGFYGGGFTKFGGAVPYRPAEDLAYSVAEFIQSSGSFINYYMYHGGTNFGRTAGGPFIATSYDYDAPLDEFGML
ncbi:unnamed protein product [Lactuca virosa]|uniref:beta-galactosidase n=1 Tax=Lactuca virosa TaxID=75947 RepID=A0AAU9LM41_9ASTR|nr:unnamed protein product [Lactuca virosa]